MIYSITGSLFGDDEELIDVCFFEDMPLSDKYTVINHWRSGDIIDLLIEEGCLTKYERKNSKIVSVRVQSYYNMYIQLSLPKHKMITEYTVGVSRINSHITTGANYKIKDMDQKIRDIKLKRILDSK